MGVIGAAAAPEPEATPEPVATPLPTPAPIATPLPGAEVGRTIVIQIPASAVTGVLPGSTVDVVVAAEPTPASATVASVSEPAPEARQPVAETKGS